jgi:hypothetical protein
MVMPSMLMPVMLGIIYRKTPWWSGMACLVAGVVTTFTLFGLDLFPNDVYPRNVIGTAVSTTLVFVISAFFYRADDPRSQEAIKLDRDLRTPVEEDSAEVDPAAMQVYGMVGNVCYVLSAVLLLCTLLPATATAPASINTIGAVILVVLGWALRRLAKVKVEPSA